MNLIRIVLLLLKKDFFCLNITYGYADKYRILLDSLIYIHMCELHPNKSENNINKYLKFKGICNVILLKLNFNYPERYPSFKMFPVKILDEVRKPDLWSSGMRINGILESETTTIQIFGIITYYRDLKQ